MDWILHSCASQFFLARGCTEHISIPRAVGTSFSSTGKESSKGVGRKVSLRLHEKAFGN